jgi:S1-C subfamily serine protease
VVLRFRVGHGGPLFNEKGEVIGITVATLDAKNVFAITGAIPQNINFAIKSAYVKNLLSMIPELGSAMVQPTDRRLESRAPKSFMKRTKNNIVLIEAQ